MSALNLDAFIALLSLPGVKRVMVVQCAFGAVSSKPTAWVHFGVDLQDMPSKRPRSKRAWLSQTNDTAVIKTAPAYV